MLRFLPLIAIVFCATPLSAAEPQLLVKLDAKVVDKGKAMAINTRMVSTSGQGMSVQVEDAHRTKFELTVTVLEGKPQYVAEMQVTRDGRIVSTPKVISTLGTTAAVQVGEGEDLIRIDLNVLRKSVLQR